MTNHSELDRLLDRALSEYGAESPRLGLEQRIVAKLHEQKPRSVRWWIWATVPALSAIILVLAMLWRSPADRPNVAVVKPPVSTLDKLTVAPHAPQTVIVRRKPRRPVRPVIQTPKVLEESPRLATFPARDGDEALARLALSFVQNNPAAARAFVEEQQQFMELAAAETAPLPQ